MHHGWGENECIWDFGGEARRKETTRKNLTQVGEIRWSGMDWIHMAQYWGQCRALVNTGLNLRVS
jgi:hypothetical protein